MIALSGLVYNLLLLIFSPLLFIWYLWRILISRKSEQSWQENLGYLPRLSERPKGRQLAWIHAASVGEVVSSLPVEMELKRQLPDLDLLVTTITQTGNSVAQKNARNLFSVSYFPLDYPILVRRALSRVKPDVFVMVEGEIWPNMLASLKQKGVPTVLISGTVSDKSMHRNRWWGWLMRWAVSNIDFCCMQTETDAERICTMGVDPSRVMVTGSTKFDQDGIWLDDSSVKTLRTSLGLPQGVPVLIAGSTNPGEDEPVLDAFEKIRKARTDLRLIIAPRQLERAGDVRSLVESRGLSCAMRSSDGTPDGWDVLILDSFGELAGIYAVGELAFVGGTFVPKGGHSIIQPILQGKPVFFGPHTFKTRDIARMVVSRGVGFQVADSDELTKQCIDILASDTRRKEISAECRKLVEENRGASMRCAEMIAKQLASRECADAT